jgi:hypothetical protein
MNPREIAPPVISAGLAVISCVADWHDMGVVVLAAGIAGALIQIPSGRCRCDDARDRLRNDNSSAGCPTSKSAR